MAKSRRRPVHVYEDLVARQAKSGLSVCAFAKLEGVPTSTLAQWKKRLSKRKSTTPAKVLLPVRVASAPVRRADPLPLAEFEVRLRSGHELRLARGFDPATLRALVEILG